jgi:DNA (cytosine-5)-methyltransferase 1
MSEDRDIRRKLGFTEEDFEFLIGLPQKNTNLLSQWESGSTSLSNSKLDLISRLPTKIPFKNTNKSKFKFIDLFAGVGGIRMPFQELNGECVFSSEWDKFAQKTYAVNYGELPKGDITTISSKDIPEHDILLAGFPCQAFSNAGLKKGFDDTRGTLFFEIQRIIAHHKPKAFLLENVKQFKGHDKGKTLETILSVLSGNHSQEIPKNIKLSKETRKALETKLNYSITYKVLSSKDFGVPQNRQRIYIVGFDKEQVDINDDDIDAFFENIISNNYPNPSLRKALFKNSEVENKYTISDRLWHGHQRRKIEHSNKGNGFGYQLFTHKDSYCNTMSARYYKDGSEILIDQSDLKKNPRKITPREAARIQGFPDKYYLGFTSDVQCYKQFGNSVSVPVVRAIAAEMSKFIL